MRAGRLNERVAFQRRAPVADEYGSTDTGPWETMFERRALFLMRPGDEVFQAARIEGVQPVRVVVRYDPQTSAVATDWRLIDLATGRVLEIKAADDMNRRRKWWTLECVAGGNS